MAKKNKKRILICDDHIESSERWKSALLGLGEVARLFDVSTCSPDSISEQIALLANRRLEIRKGASQTERNDSVFDDLDVLVVDYDLQDRDPRSGREIAYLARCFSGCGLVITINEHGENPFDLTLSGYTDSFADLNIGSQQLFNLGLWKNGWEAFRPWGWPLVPQALEDFRSRAAELSNKLDSPVFEFLGLTESGQYLNKSLTAFLSTPKKPVSAVTFREFVFNSESALAFRDRTSAPRLLDEQQAAIAAARISHWLERLLLPSQHILVDAPHLLSRHPSLRKSKSATDKALNKAAQLLDVSELGLNEKILEPHRFAKDNWLSREAWFWPSLSKDKEIPAISNPFSEETLDLRFCEEASRFLKTEETREFSADVNSQFVRRYLVDPESCQNKKLVQSLESVQFHPSSRLAF
jgi:hypothetical protein